MRGRGTIASTTSRWSARRARRWTHGGRGRTRQQRAGASEAWTHLLYPPVLAIMPILTRPGRAREHACQPCDCTLRSHGSRRRPMTEPLKMEDLDPVETQEWLESIDSVLKTHGAGPCALSAGAVDRLHPQRRLSAVQAQYGLCQQHPDRAGTRVSRQSRARAAHRGVHALERGGHGAAGQQDSSEFGGHLASYASSATLYEVGFNHFWRAPSEQHPGDMVFIRGIPRPASTRAPIWRGG